MNNYPLINIYCYPNNWNFVNYGYFDEFGNYYCSNPLINVYYHNIDEVVPMEIDEPESAITYDKKMNSNQRTGNQRNNKKDIGKKVYDKKLKNKCKNIFNIYAK